MAAMAPASSTDVDETFLGGKLLIATPSIGDPRFDRTVIVMCDHSPDHAMGIIINKPADDLRLPELFEQLGVDGIRPAPDTPVLIGGPVDQDRKRVVTPPTRWHPHRHMQRGIAKPVAGIVHPGGLLEHATVPRDIGLHQKVALFP